MDTIHQSGMGRGGWTLPPDQLSRISPSVYGGKFLQWHNFGTFPLSNFGKLLACYLVDPILISSFKNSFVATFWIKAKIG